IWTIKLRSGFQRRILKKPRRISRISHITISGLCQLGQGQNPGRRKHPEEFCHEKNIPTEHDQKKAYTWLS
ncbi:MAG: hypothetical protein LBC10_02225, partial [Deltaproteobacteria bacterium]|nr:hypothetical protein [Deltaproteobacteria bacterium]